VGDDSLNCSNDKTGDETGDISSDPLGEDTGELTVVTSTLPYI